MIEYKDWYGRQPWRKRPASPAPAADHLLQRLERVGETGRLRIVDNSANFGPLLPDALIKRRAIVAVVNHIERRRPVRQRTDAKKGFRSDIFLSCTG